MSIFIRQAYEGEECPQCHQKTLYQHQRGEPSLDEIIEWYECDNCHYNTL